uniref:Uncharacterized protein n=1 Tax=Tetraselmis sp. GSL018 TaxID=582737 RepID=A0A061S205_9CHLO|mmetsp:Transcript_15787/g.37478  ORF Transcript_15787/g.37478 Transcript_15787/m.37478 type:complete len:158 (+) Transcript_15787:273-746(+)
MGLLNKRENDTTEQSQASSDSSRPKRVVHVELSERSRAKGGIILERDDLERILSSKAEEIVYTHKGDSSYNEANQDYFYDDLTAADSITTHSSQESVLDATTTPKASPASVFATVVIGGLLMLLMWKLSGNFRKYATKMARKLWLRKRRRFHKSRGR